MLGIMKKIETYFILLCMSIFLLFISCYNEDNLALDHEIEMIESNFLPRVILKNDSSKIDIYQSMEKHKVKGLSIAVVQNGLIRWNKTYGMSNERDSVSTNTLFQAGSISKPVAALAILKLVNDKKVELDVDVDMYLKTWKLNRVDKNETEKVTIRRLLSHTAGISVSGFSGYSKDEKLPNLDEVLNGEAKSAKIEVIDVPGTNWNYSGGGYTVLQKVVEDVTGMAFEKYVETNVLKPFGMNNSKYYPIIDADSSNTSSGYVDGEILKEGWLYYPQPTAAGLWSTSTDLAKFCIEIQNIAQNKTTDGIISKKLVSEMFKRTKNNWGLGFELNGEGDSLVFQHNGNTKGFTASFKGFANSNNGVVIMTNSDMAENFIDEAIRTVSVYYDWGISKPIMITSVKLTNDQLEKLVGDYEYEKEIPNVGKYIVKIKLIESTLYLVDGENKIKLTPTAPNKFTLVEAGREIVFESENDKIISYTMDNMFRFNKN